MSMLMVSIPYPDGRIHQLFLRERQSDLGLLWRLLYVSEVPYVLPVWECCCKELLAAMLLG